MGPAHLVALLVGGAVGAALSVLHAAAILAAARRTAARHARRGDDECARLSADHARGWREQSTRRERESGRWVAEGRKKINTRAIVISARVRRLDRQADAFDTRGAELSELERQLEARKADVEAREQRLAAIREQARRALFDACGRTEAEAREAASADVARAIEEERVRATARQLEALTARVPARARAIIAIAVGRCNVSHAHPACPSVVALPATEEGAPAPEIDVEAFRETVAGLLDVELTHDAEARTIHVACPDGVTREVARRAVATLVAEGGDPELATIAALEEVDPELRVAADESLRWLGIDGLPAEVVETFGRLRFRTSYGQNVLYHSVEVALLCAALAAELGLDVPTALQAGLFHDLGKALDHDRDEGHPELGSALLRAQGMPTDVVEAARDHHKEPRSQPLYSLLVCAADTISAARLGARRESFEQYVRRLERLEMIANSHFGVTTSYAIRAGRELRVMVAPEEVDDDRAGALAREIAEQIHSQLDFPGKVRVTVIRERRVIEYAR